MDFFPFIYEKPKPENEPIPLYQELEDPNLSPLPKREEPEKEESSIIEIQL